MLRRLPTAAAIFTSLSTAGGRSSGFWSAGISVICVRYCMWPPKGRIRVHPVCVTTDYSRTKASTD